MSIVNEFHTLINQLYTAENLLKKQHALCRAYDGILLYDKESHTLACIAQNEGISQMQLSERMHCTKSATSMMVDKLIEKQLVVRQRSEEDRRLYTLMLTDLGRSVNDAHQAADLNFAKKLADNLPVDEAAVSAANNLLSKVIAFYAAYTPDHSTSED